ncbi:FeoA family protein [Acetohalobium arabaticum]|uniref:FeoA family protein n=1 Tax=Acetohalobium arabaticum (strain ATCC 49924 / DSM 5501 / Z-7288) TaxID=574087 RepID=D9QSA7_ACEAZ|nr:FeoA family protein [Acetohalobium arabaticum]ADL11563.1 FeoA family protein [Acetohalobium arabaticum DSM 5501]
MKLTNIPIGKSGKVMRLTCQGQKRRRLLDLGLIPGTIVRAKQKSPFGDPIAFEIRGATMALRSEETEAVIIEEVKKNKKVS